MYPRRRDNGSLLYEKYGSWVGGFVNIAVQMPGSSPGMAADNSISLSLFHWFNVLLCRSKHSF